MQVLKKILIVVLAIVVVVFVVGLLLPGEVVMERETVIDAPPEVVFEQINELRNWDNWTVWHQIDPENTTYVYSDPSSGLGAGYTWESENDSVGSGSLEITESVPFEKVATVMDFGDQGTAKAWFSLTDLQEGTKVVWGFQTELGLNPISRIFGLFLEKWLAPDYEKGLAKLKEVSEANADEREAEMMLEDELSMEEEEMMME